MASTLQEQLDAKREQFDEEGAWLRFLLEAFLGSGGFQGRVKQPPAGWWGSAAEAYSGFATTSLKDAANYELNTYLDRHLREDMEKFQRRVQVSHYLNYLRPTTNLKVSYVVRKPHARNNVPPRLQDWITSTGYDDDYRQRVLRAGVLGWFPMRVDMPRVDPEARTAAQAGVVEPYCTAMLPCTLLDYEIDERNELVWAKTKIEQSRRSAFDAPKVNVKRYEVWTREDLTVYEVEEVEGGQLSEPRKTGPTKHGFKAVPIVSWRAETSVDDPIKADSLNADIAPEARRLFNLMSEFDEHIRGQAFALLVWPKKQMAADAAGGKGQVGVENGLIIDPEQKQVPYYLAPPGDLAATFETRIERSIIEIYRMARVEYDRASGVRSSAQSKEQNFEQTNLSIADFAQALARADRETLILVGRGLGIDDATLDKIECVPDKDFATKELNEEIESVVQALTLRMGKTFGSEMLKRLTRRMLPNLAPETLKTIDAEIEQEALKAEQEAAVLREEAHGGDDPGGDGEGNDDPQKQRQAA